MRQIIIFTIFLSVLLSAVSAVECTNTLSVSPCDITSNLQLVPGTYGPGELSVYSGVTFDLNGSDVNFDIIIVGSGVVVKNGVLSGFSVGQPESGKMENVTIDSISVDSREYPILFWDYRNLTIKNSEFIGSNTLNVIDGYNNEYLTVLNSNFTDAYSIEACRFTLTPGSNEFDFESDAYDLGWNNVDEPENLYPGAAAYFALANETTHCETDAGDLSWSDAILELQDIMDSGGYFCVNTTQADIVKVQVDVWIEDDSVEAAYDTDGSLSDSLECANPQEIMFGARWENARFEVQNSSFVNTGDWKKIELSRRGSWMYDSYFENVVFEGYGDLGLQNGTITVGASNLYNSRLISVGGQYHHGIYFAYNSISSDAALDEPFISLENAVLYNMQFYGNNVSLIDTKALNFYQVVPSTSLSFVWLYDNKFDMFGGRAVSFQNSNIKTLVVENSEFSLTGVDQGIRLDNSNVTDSIRFSNNEISGVIGNETGIFMSSNVYSQIFGAENNTFHKLVDTIWWLSGSLIVGDQANITGNYFANCSYGPGVTGVDSVLIKGNEFRDIKLQGITSINAISGTIADNLIVGDSNRTRTNKGRGMYVQGTASAVDNQYVVNNTLIGDMGIQVAIADSVVVANNSVSDFALANKATTFVPLLIQSVISGAIMNNSISGELVDGVDTFYTDNATVMFLGAMTTGLLFEDNRIQSENGGGIMVFGRKRISDGVVLNPQSNVTLRNNYVGVDVRVLSTVSSNNKFEGNYIKKITDKSTSDKAYNNQIGEAYDDSSINADYCNNTYSGYNNIECPNAAVISCPSVIPNAGNYPNRARFNITYAVTAPRGVSTISAYNAKIDELTREGVCTKNDINSTYSEIVCVVEMDYWEDSLLYDVSGNISDGVARNETYYGPKGRFLQADFCEYYQLLAKFIQNPVLNFEISAGQSDVFAEVPMNVSNWGNVDLVNLSIVAFDLPGLTLPNTRYAANNFKMNDVPSAVGAVVLQHNVSKSKSFSLAAGNGSTALVYLIASMPANQYPQNYRANVPWTLTLS
jgi:hypothetical protein